MLARVLSEMLDGSSELEWCDSEGSSCGTREEDEDVTDHWLVVVTGFPMRA